MIKVGIVGCGKMADNHAYQIQNIPEARIEAVCDTENLMAKQMAERFRIPSHFAEITEMLKSVKLDVVHITTPPQSHFALAKMCLEEGCHVYMEKPFTVCASEAEELLRLADRVGRKIIAGHNAQFTPAMVRMRELVKSGFLGGPPVHMDSQYCYDFSDPGFAKALLGDDEHWVRKLPGSLLQNIISHGISKIAEFLSGENPQVIALGFTSPFLRRIGEEAIVDEVRVIIQDDHATTAYFTFSSQIGPAPHQFRLYGPKNSLIVDDDHQVVIKLRNKDYKSYLRYFIPPFGYARQYLGNVSSNFAQFLKRDFLLPNEAGLKKLMISFYKALSGKAPMPLSRREILLTARIMEAIFAQLREQHAP